MRNSLGWAGLEAGPPELQMFGLGAKILGFGLDKKRIPGIDILLKQNQKQKIGNLEFEVIFIPGHTKGHIAFHFKYSSSR